MRHDFQAMTHGSLLVGVLPKGNACVHRHVPSAHTMPHRGRQAMLPKYQEAVVAAGRGHTWRCMRWAPAWPGGAGQWQRRPGHFDVRGPSGHGAAQVACSLAFAACQALAVKKGRGCRPGGEAACGGYDSSSPALEGNSESSRLRLRTQVTSDARDNCLLGSLRDCTLNHHGSWILSSACCARCRSICNLWV